MIRALLVLLMTLWAGAAFAQAPQTDAERCQALEGGRFQSLASAPTWIVKASIRPAGDGKPASCLIEGYVNPTVNFAIIMPVANWNGRYLVRGCGGSCGAVAIEIACQGHIKDGYACLHTDMGHRSTLIDNNWVDNNLQGLVDFGYRATHVTTKAGRAILKAFYGSDPRKSYFFACSTGGRQALIEAQRFPEDFDGVVAIAPASMAPFGSKKAASISDVDALNLDAAGNPILPNRKALLIHRAAVARCDKADGIADGIIGNPISCPFKPAELLCKGSDTRNCLTLAQVGVAEKLYTLRGAMPGSEFNWIGNFLRNAPLPGETSQPLNDLGVGRGDPVVIETMIAPNNPDLRPFRDNGGKLILVHGWSDFSTMPLPTLDYYETVTRTMGGPEKTRDFARLFMIPGMDHCAGGDGASAIDYMAAITAWVEQGEAPDALRGAHVAAGAPLDYFAVELKRLDPKYIEFERDHQAWPKGSITAGKRAETKPLRPLDQMLAQAIADGEKSAAAGFPRRSMLNLMLKGMWEALYRAETDDASQVAALDRVAATPLSPLGREAVARMQAELQLN